jgi:methyl-accepting chemotaxis protein
MTIRRRLWLMIGLSALCVLLVTWVSLSSKRRTMLDDRSRATRFAVETAWGVVAQLERAAEAGSLSADEARKQAIGQLKSLRYDEGEYFFIIDLQPKMVMHPVKPELDGKDLADTKDPHGRPLFRDMVAVARREGAGFVHYDWPRPGSEAPVPKVSYVKLHRPWGWVIGSGVYVDDIDQAISTDLWRLAALVLVVLGSMVAFALILARSITTRVAAAVDVANSVAHGHYESAIDLKGRDEVSALLHSLATMQTGLRQRQESDRRSAMEMSRLKCALDNVKMNVWVADNEAVLLYLNKSLTETLRRSEGAVQQQHPAFSVATALGRSLGVFYRDPSAFLERLRQSRATERSKLQLGDRSFEVITTPVLSEAGERLGVVGQWVDLTEQQKAEEETSTILLAAGRGDFTQRIALEGKEGFFLQVAQAMNALMETSSTGLNEVVRVLAALAKGDLTETVRGESANGRYEGTFGRLQDDCNATVAHLTETVSRLKEVADAIRLAAREIASGNTDLSQRTEKQAASLEETAASVEELTSTVKQNADNAAQANQLASSASSIATKGGDVVGQVVHTMSSIRESSNRIVDIIGVIDDIAFQTNILALNAAVEAARAGEQGRGFAVVASEVRSLAQRSAGAAREIKALISDSVDKVKVGTELADAAGQTMGEVVSSVRRVTSIIGEISAASVEQSTGIEQVNQAIAQMDSATQQNVSLVEQASAAAGSLEDQADRLNELMSSFRLAEGAGGASD